MCFRGRSRDRGWGGMMASREGALEVDPLISWPVGQKYKLEARRHRGSVEQREAGIKGGSIGRPDSLLRLHYGRGARPARPRMTGPVIPTHARSIISGLRFPFEPGLASSTFGSPTPTQRGGAAKAAAARKRGRREFMCFRGRGRDRGWGRMMASREDRWA